MSSDVDIRSRAAARCLALAAIFGGLGVALGAFAAHGLKSILAPDALATFETGVRYQMYHAFALAACGALALSSPAARTTSLSWLFASGILVFSGSLYILALTGIRIFGAITPVGGVLLLCGWGVFLVRAVRIASSRLSHTAD